MHLSSIQTSNKIPKGTLFFFLIWPFFALFYGIKNYRQPWAKNVIWLFTIFFGLSFVIMEGIGSDSVRYARNLEVMASGDLTIQQLWSLFYAEGSGLVDILNYLLTFFVSRITSDYRLLMASYGLVFGYFYSRNIWMVIDNTDKRLNIYSIVLLLSFTFIVNPHHINGFRFYTAVHIFFFGMLLLLMKNKKSGLWIAASSMLVHFAFMIPIATMFIYLLAGNRKTLYFLMFFSSVFLIEIDVDFFRELHSYLPTVFMDHSASYLGEAYVEQAHAPRTGARAWYITYHSLIFKWIIVFFVSYIFLFRRKSQYFTPFLSRLFCFGLLFGTVANVMSVIPSVGRFSSLSEMFLVAFIFLFIQRNYDKHFHLFLKASAPLLVFYIIIRIRYVLDFIGVLTVAGNPILVILFKDDTNLITYIKMLF